MPAGRLPPIRQPTDVIGTVTQQTAGQTGLAAGTPLVAGTADHVGAALATCRSSTAARAMCSTARRRRCSILASTSFR
ncbi:MAG: hypothetical protein ACP5HM_01565 [Anaerolineae bacterium]